MVITACRFVGNTAQVSHGLCTLPFCVLLFLQMLHFKLTLILLLLLVYCYAFESMVVPFLIMKGQWLSQDLSSREIQQL